MLELKREDHVRAQKDTLVFIALPFTYVPKGLEMVSLQLLYSITIVVSKVSIDSFYLFPIYFGGNETSCRRLCAK